MRRVCGGHPDLMARRNLRRWRPRPARRRAWPTPGDCARAAPVAKPSRPTSIQQSGKDAQEVEIGHGRPGEAGDLGRLLASLLWSQDRGQARRGSGKGPLDRARPAGADRRSGQGIPVVVSSLVMFLSRRLIVVVALLVTVMLLHLVYTWIALDTDRWLFSVEVQRLAESRRNRTAPLPLDQVQRLGRLHQITVPEGGVVFGSERGADCLFIRIEQSFYSFRLSRTLTVIVGPAAAAEHH
jgi:hypothetical protein